MFLKPDAFLIPTVGYPMVGVGREKPASSRLSQPLLQDFRLKDGFPTSSR